MTRANKLKPGETNDAPRLLDSETSPHALLECFTPNPRNPRRSARAIDEMAASLAAHGQLQAVVAVSVDRWIERWPEDANKLDLDAHMVTLIGSRRLLGARQIEYQGLDYTLRDDLLDHPMPFLAAAIENIIRRDMSILDEARVVAEVAEHLKQESGEEPTDEQIAVHFSKHRTWVGQRRGLLRLTQEVQDLVDQHEVSLRVARAASALPADEQKAYVLANLEPDEDDEGQAEPTGEGDTAVSPRLPRQVKPPTRKATLKVLSGYWREHGSGGVAELLREQLEPAAVAELVAALTAVPAEAAEK